MAKFIYPTSVVAKVSGLLGSAAVLFDKLLRKLVVPLEAGSSIDLTNT